MASFFNLSLDTLAPGGLSITLNDGALYTTSAAVTLKTTTTDQATTGYQMKVWGVSGAASEAQASWVTFAGTKSITLTTGDGLKTVYVKIRDDVGNETATASDTITLDTAVPVVTITGPDRSKVSKVSGFDTSVIDFVADVDFVEYVVKVVPSTSSLQSAGTTIPETAGSINTSGTGTFESNTNIQTTIKGADLESASSGDGTKIIKVFVKTAAGTWSVA
jgi:hypothetical protein